ncbi:MAG: hypothetical protein FWC79_07705 [Oscillospiraceae bacterium]|nr:hypothetical protein [Oscillospiraceae bacterium]
MNNKRVLENVRIHKYNLIKKLAGIAVLALLILISSTNFEVVARENIVDRTTARRHTNNSRVARFQNRTTTEVDFFGGGTDSYDFEFYESLGMLERVQGGVILHSTPDSLIMPLNSNVSNRGALQTAVNSAPQNGTQWTIFLTQSFSSTASEQVVTISGNRNILLTSQGSNNFTWTHTTANQRHFIVNDGARLTLQNVTLSGNQASVNTIHGGIEVRGTGSRLYMNEGSTIRGNRALSGGGVIAVLRSYCYYE